MLALCSAPAVSSEEEIEEEEKACEDDKLTFTKVLKNV